MQDTTTERRDAEGSVAEMLWFHDLEHVVGGANSALTSIERQMDWHMRSPELLGIITHTSSTQTEATIKSTHQSMSCMVIACPLRM